ncbi:MazF family transcriptional regulator [Methylobacterium sp. E-025]|uniref:AbrB/MazE/SpoVT family DNA-binding domain-containing protein n=1 Tax=unclassified Methylobacterium TaxID=2615210 RepID=UPI001FB979A3|nr:MULTISPECIES: MazF family transcriptional regulator [unclassified Methylobacterium]MCJ2077221.1 MazF family transcriptional regulator [Methylobacterium sp. E-016]MCJ2113865.1 MazF family transcriptional regulator [Methylobacterium sp. E-025]
MEGKLERSGEAFAVRLSAEDVRSLGLSEGQTVEVTAKDPLPNTIDATSSVQVRRYVNGIPVFTMAEMVAEARRLGPAFEPPTVDWGPDRGSEIIDDDDPR